MNAYRNWHYHTANKFKTEFEELVYNQIPDVFSPIKGTFALSIGIYYKNPACDPSNISALIEKVVLDALQRSSVVVNDSVKYHVKTTWIVAGRDTDNPRAEVTLKEIK